MNGVEEDDFWLNELAGTVLDGTPADLEESDAAVSDSRRAAVRQARIVARIAEVHRTFGEDFERTQTESDHLLDRPLTSWGRLTIHEEIGRGAFGTVYRAWDSRLERYVALKLFQPRTSVEPDRLAASVIEEGRLLARVHHPNIVTVYDADRIAGWVGLTMEFVRGRTLEQMLREHGPFSANEVAAIGTELCGALAAVHGAGLLHRDLKAQNVMRCDDGRLVLMDFGAGLVLEEANLADGDVAGTPLYLAPELFEGQPATQRSDIYSLGVLLYHLLTNAYPVSGATVHELRDAHRSRRHESLLQRARPDVPRALARVIDRAKAVNPIERYARAEEMAAALKGAVQPRRAAWHAGIVLSAAGALAATAALTWTFVSRSAQHAGGGAPPASHGAIGVSDRTAKMRRLDIPRLLFAGRLSQSGKYLPYSAESLDRLMLMDLASGTVRQLVVPSQPSDDVVAESLVSPDDMEVAYSWESSSCRCVELRTVDAESRGGPPRVLMRDESLLGMQLADYSQDGGEILALMSRKDRTHQIALVSARDGSVRVLKAGLEHSVSLHLSPDGQYVAYDYPVRADDDGRDIFILATDGTSDERLLQGRSQDAYPLWTPDGRGILFVSDRSGTPGLWLASVVAGKLQGPPQIVNKDIGTIRPQSISRDGTLLYQLQAGDIDVYMARLSPDGTVMPGSIARAAGSFLASNSDPVWSSDGRSMAYVSRRRSTGPRQNALVIRSLDTGEERELWPDVPGFVQPQWSPDGGSFLIWTADRLGAGGGWQIDATTASTLKTFGPIRTPKWAANGDQFFFFRLRDFTRLFSADLASGRTREIYRAPAGHSIQSFIAVSPDGQWLAMTINEPGGQATRLDVVPAVGGPAHTVMRMSYPDLFSIQQWARGDSILYTKFRAEGILGRSPAPGSLYELWSLSAWGGAARSLGLALDRLDKATVGPDGQRIVFKYGGLRTEYWLMDHFLPPTAVGTSR